MAAGDIVPVAGEMFEQTLASASPDVLREMIREFARRMMDADIEVRLQRGIRGGDPGPGAHSSGSVSRTGNSDRADVSWTRVNRPGVCRPAGLRRPPLPGLGRSSRRRCSRRASRTGTVPGWAATWVGEVLAVPQDVRS